MVDPDVLVWETVPAYSEFYGGMWDFFKFYWNISDGTTIPSHFRFVKEHHRISRTDVFLVLVLAAIWTAVRHYCTKNYFQPLGKKFQLTPKNQEKMPESAWKFLWYLSAWSLTCYIAVYKYKFFQRPSSVWKGWSLDSEVPMDLYVLYIMQISFYLHSTYSAIFLDVWRKDTVMLIVHHVITLLTFGYSHAFRFHNTGAIVILFHDISDVQMEFAKLHIYFKIQNNKLVKFHETVSNISFGIFALTWYLSRLYWFPLKAIYTLSAITNQLGLIGKLPVLPVIVSLASLLFVMNCYWFMLILRIVYNVATGQMVDDIREYDVEERLRKASKTKNGKSANGYYQNGSISKGRLTKDENGSSYPTKRKQVRADDNNYCSR